MNAVCLPFKTIKAARFGLLFVVLKCRVCEIFRTFRFSRFLHVSFFKSSTFRFAGFKQCQVSFCTQKKRETERWIGQGGFRTNDESIGRHHYSSLMVALSVAFYARLSVGSRQIVEIFNILNEFMGNVFGKVPAYTTIGYWTQELGLSVYKESCSLFKDKRYALIVDESMMIGSEKLLLTLAMPAINAGSAITEKDITIVDISIAKS